MLTLGPQVNKTSTLKSFEGAGDFWIKVPKEHFKNLKIR